MLESAAVHLNREELLSVEHAAFALREAIMSIIKLANGKDVIGIREAATRVVDLNDAGVEDGLLSKSIEDLRMALASRGPNNERLERAVAAWSRSRPTRATGDRLEQLIAALNRANHGLHGDSPPALQELADAYGMTCVALTDLFRPLSERLAALADLVALERPGRADVARLRERLGDGHPLSYLFAEATGPGWLKALADDPLLLPPEQDPWVATPYVARLAESHPDDVRGWLATVPGDLNTKQTYDLLWAARRVAGDGVLAVVLRLARKHLGSPDVRFHVDGLLRDVGSVERDTPAGRSLVQQMLAQTLAESSRTRDTWMAGELATMAIDALAGDHTEAWLTMLAHRAREVAEGENHLRLRAILPLDELGIRACPLVARPGRRGDARRSQRSCRRWPAA
jgi:hypothetical protein